MKTLQMSKIEQDEFREIINKIVPLPMSNRASATRPYPLNYPSNPQPFLDSDNRLLVEIFLLLISNSCL